jgi:low affinity Fe/Cu permease
MKKILTMMLMMASVLFFACSDDDENEEPLSTDEARDQMTQMSQDMFVYMNEMETAEGMNAILTLDSLMYIDDPFEQKSFSESNRMIENIQKFILPANYLNFKSDKTKADGAALSLSEVVTYTWNETNQQWTYSSEPTDKLIFVYPLEEKQAQLTINDYQEVEIQDDYDTWYQPISIDAALYVNDTEAACLSLTASWVESGEAAGEPKSINVDGGILPFTFTFNFNFSNYIAKITNTKVFNGNTLILNVEAAATFEADNMIDEPVNLTGYLQIDNARLNIKQLKIKEIDEVISNYESNPTTSSLEDLENAINSKISIDISIDDRFAADIILAIIEVEPESTPPTPIDILGYMGLYGDLHIVYSDGTYDSLFGMVPLQQ